MLVIAGPVADGAAVRAVCERLRAVMSTTTARTIVVDAGSFPATCRSIEVLARLQLTARRAGGRIRLQRASPPLRNLLEFAGLADIVQVGAHDP